MKNLRLPLLVAALALVLPHGARAQAPKPETPAQQAAPEAPKQEASKQGASPKAASKKEAPKKEAPKKDSPAIEKARALFQTYQELSSAFDPALADLYADDALIQTVRVLPSGEKKKLSMPASRWKQLVRNLMPQAKKVGDADTFSDCQYAELGERVRIDCMRHASKKNYTSPHRVVVGPSPSGAWLVYEEHSVTRQ